MNTKIALHETTINSFTTAGSGIIDFVDGYYEAYNRKRSEYVADNVFVANIKSDRDKLHSEPFSFSAFIKDVDFSR